MSLSYTGPKKRAEDRDKRWRWSEWFYKYSFIWWPLLLAGVAYPAKVISGLRADTQQTVKETELRLQVQIDTLKVQVTKGADERKEMKEMLQALLRIQCADQTSREKVRTGTAVACARVGAPANGF